jgi:CHRD domain/PEP-CTERM motif
MRIAQITLVTGLFFGSAAFSAPISYFAILNGPSESPANLSPGTGLAHVTIDLAVQTMLVDVTFTGLEAGDTASHIHCCTAVPEAGTAGVATITPTFTGFPGGVTSGSYVHTFLLNDAGTYNPAFITAQGSLANAEAALVAGMAARETYLNIHTTSFPGGEIRGFLEPVPEPSTLLLAGAALASLMLLRRRRQV